MRKTEFLTIGKRLAASFPNFVVKGSLMFIQPLGDTLRGFLFEPSGFNKTNFYVNSFFLPLYVPTSQIHLTFGHRVGCNKRWSADQPGIEDSLKVEMQKELPFLSGLRSVNEVAKALEILTKPNKAGYVNPHSYEAFAYALVRAGDITGAQDVIAAMLKRVNPRVAWENEISLRASLIQKKLTADPEDARVQLAEWEAETIRDLGLEAYRGERTT